MSARSAVWNSLMNTVQVVCIENRWTMPSCTPQPMHERHHAFGEIDQLHALAWSRR